jgi:hypothetical protein
VSSQPFESEAALPASFASSAIPGPGTDDALLALSRGEEFDFSQLEDTYRFVGERHDTSDFRLQSLTRIVYDYSDSVPSEDFERLKRVFLDFKYWMDQPGDDSLCFWSENHQILFATTEYLAGQYWPNETFTNDERTGAQHRDAARERILSWLEQRWNYGFTEWYSNVYYVEDIAPLANLIDFAQDEEIAQKATMIMDLLLHDVASQSQKGVFLSTSGRHYEGNKKNNGGNSMRGVIEHVWGRGSFGYEASRHFGMDLNFALCKKYEVPEVIRAIGRDEGPSVIRASNGLNIRELAGEGLLGLDNRQIMMQWAMEAFSNPEVIENSLDYIERHGMFSNEFLQDFQMVDIGPLREHDLLPSVSRLLQPVTNGSAIQRANTYTYRTPDYMIATAQAYHPGTYGDQHHIWTATLSEEVAVFTTHPAAMRSTDGKVNSPGYWIGNGRVPHSVQHESVVLSLYQIPEQPGFLEETVFDFTHAYFPRDKFGELVIDGRYAFARHRNTLVAFIGRNPLAYAEGSDEDLIQQGRDAYWIFEASTVEVEGGLDAFADRIRGNAVEYSDATLVYESFDRSHQVEFGGEFHVNDELVNVEHQRFDSPYSQTPRKARAIRFAHDGHELELDFHGMKRESR